MMGECRFINIGFLLCAIGAILGGCVQTAATSGNMATTAASSKPTTLSAVPDQAELLNILRTRCRIDEADPKLTSLEAVINAGAGPKTSMRVHYFYRRPGMYSLRWELVEPKLLLYMFNQEQGIACDFLQQGIMKIKSGKPPALLFFKGANGKMELLTGMDSNDANAPVGKRVFLDLDSWVTPSAGDRIEAVRQADGNLRITRYTTKGKWGYVVLDLSKPMPLVSIVFLNDNDEITMQLTLSVNADVGDERFVLPDERVLARHLKIFTLDTTVVAGVSFLSNIYIAGGLILPEDRQEIEKKIGQKIDWDAIESFAKQAGVAFHEVDTATSRPAN